MTTRCRWIVACVLGLLGSTVALMAAGTATWTKPATDTYSIAWTSTAGGAVSGNPNTVAMERLLQVEFIPGAGGAQPSNSYAVTLVDVNGVDLLGGAGAALSNTAASVLVANPPVVVTSNNVLDLVVAGAGSAKSGTVVLWFQR